MQMARHSAFIGRPQAPNPRLPCILREPIINARSHYLQAFTRCPTKIAASSLGSGSSSSSNNSSNGEPPKNLVPASASVPSFPQSPSNPDVINASSSHVPAEAWGLVALAVLIGGSLLTAPAATAATAVATAATAAAGTATPAVTATAVPLLEVAVAAVANSGDTAWILTSTALVLFMTIPGLSLFYGGLVRQKNVISLLTQCFGCVGLVTMLWTAVGYSIAFSPTGMQAGAIGLHSFVGSLDKAFLMGVTANSLWGTIPEALFFAFQLTFAIITPALMVGAFAERMKFKAVMMFIGAWSLAVYCPVAHAVWGGAGSLFGDLGVLDFAGGIVVHVTAGVAALLACIMVGPRKENIMQPHNLALTVAGTGMLWVGWFGFNGGSALTAGGSAAMAMVVTQISAATAALVWSLLDLLDTDVRKPTSIGICTGSIAGLAAITPAAGFVGPVGAIAIGTASAIVCRLFAMRVKTNLGYDDSLDVFNVHGVGGITGTLLLSIFASPRFGGNQAGLDIGSQFVLQAGATVTVALYTVIVSWVLLKIVGKLVGGLRVDEQKEAAGLDSEHGEQGYDLMATRDEL